MGNLEMSGAALFQEMAGPMPLFAQLGWMYNFLFLFHSVPPLPQKPVVPTFSLKEQFPLPLGYMAHGLQVSIAPLTQRSWSRLT